MCVWSVCVCIYCVCTHAHTWVWILYVSVCVSVHTGCLNSLLLFWCYGKLNIGSQACYLSILPLSCIPQSYLLIVDSLTEVGWHLILNLIFLVINDVWQFFTPVWMPSLKNVRSIPLHNAEPSYLFYFCWIPHKRCMLTLSCVRCTVPEYFLQAFSWPFSAFIVS